MSQVELLRLVLSVLGQLDIDSMLVGSHASSYYGEARSTHDIDLVIDLDPTKIDSLVNSFETPRYYLSAAALREGRMANLIDTEMGDKVDLFLLSSSAQDRRAFLRRRLVKIAGIETFLSSPEDTILSKLDWSRESGGSERQLSDIQQMMIQNRTSIDVVYLREQLLQRGLYDLFCTTFGDLPGGDG